MIQTNIGNRVYAMSATETMANTKAHLLNSGFDGIVYMGCSKPVGRQVKIMSGLFYRVAKTGEFKSAF